MNTSNSKKEIMTTNVSKASIYKEKKGLIGYFDYKKHY